MATIQFEMEFDKTFESLEEAVINAFYSCGKPLRHIAGDLGYDPAGLSKRLSLASQDNNPRLNLKDLEKFIESTGDTSPILYLVKKFLQKEQDKLLHEFQAFKKHIPEIKKLIAMVEAK